MARVDGSLARRFDFDEHVRAEPRPINRKRRLTVLSATLRGPHKYKALEQRRRQAQIKARRLLDLVD